MLEPTLISPMLDKFAMGGAISDHNGVHCFPAMENETDGKYIVKVISIPASQTQLEALLLTGAYSSKDAALGYFKELADGVIREVQILEKLSQMEGFLPFQDCQAVPKDGLCGYDVYLLSPYKRTLSKQFTKHPLTQLDAVNMGLDLCAALAVCRRAGFLYVALKPNNVYITDSKEYRIGDLGFIQLDSLKYASLPDKYHSQYTPPEITDAFSSLNTTLDVYALGLMLYQTYNNGALPFDTPYPPTEVFPAPAYADYELSEIILKACAPNPEDRWQDPMEMGQALVAYMQRNGVNDTPIVPVPESKNPAAEAAGESSQTVMDNSGADSCSEQKTESTPLEDSSEIIEEGSALCNSDKTEDESDTAENTNESSEPEMTVSDNPEVDAIIQDTKAALGETDDPSSEGIPSTDMNDDLSSDGTSSDEFEKGINYDEVTDEVSEILSQADDLASHPVPEPAVAPDPIDVPVPEPIIRDMPEEEADSDNTECMDADDPAEIPENIPDVPPVDQSFEKKTEKTGHWLRYTAAGILTAALIVGGIYFYKSVYLIPLGGISLEGSRDSLLVHVDSNVDESKLSVVCSDTYGTEISAPVVDGTAIFSGLVPNTGYTVNVEISGFHKLTGNTSAAYSTPVQTNIVQYSAVTGTEDGSVILGFTIEGPDSAQWTVTYSADGEDEKTVTFPSHMVTLTGLTVGKTYHFVLAPEEDLYLTGSSDIEFAVSNLVYAEDLSIDAYENGKLSASWSAPKDSRIESWTVRCYNTDSTYNETVVTDNTSAVFENLPSGMDYTVEVTASGMSVAQRTYVTEDAITFRDVQTDLTDSGDLEISWETDQNIPEGGWIIGYSLGNSSSQETVTCTGNKAVFSPAIPGALYNFNVQEVEGNMILGFPSSYQMPVVTDFACNYEGHALKAEDLNFRMCKRPSSKSWNRNFVSESDYGNSYPVNQDFAFVVKIDKEYGTSEDNIVMLYVIRDAEGNVISANTHEDSWRHMWNDGYCELNVPGIPQIAGDYTINVYFNGALAAEQSFTITE